MSNRFTPGFISCTFDRFVMITISTVDDDDISQSRVMRLFTDVIQNQCFIDFYYITICERTIS